MITGITSTLKTFTASCAFVRGYINIYYQDIAKVRTQRQYVYSRFTCLKIAVYFTGSFPFFFLFLLTSAEITAFHWLKALFSAGVSKKKREPLEMN